MSASNQTYTTWSGAIGSGTPHVFPERDTLTSSRPDSITFKISLRRISGRTKSGLARMCAFRRSLNFESAKK